MAQAGSALPRQGRGRGFNSPWVHRGIAQLGRAPALGAGDCRFKSCYPDVGQSDVRYLAGRSRVAQWQSVRLLIGMLEVRVLSWERFHADVSQLVEDAGSDPVCCRFESCRRYRPDREWSGSSTHADVSQLVRGRWSRASEVQVRVLSSALRWKRRLSPGAQCAPRWCLGREDRPQPAKLFTPVRIRQAPPCSDLVSSAGRRQECTTCPRSSADRAAQRLGVGVIQGRFAEAPGPGPWCRRPQVGEPHPPAGKRVSLTW
jgi:hypothetical protein